VSDKELNERPEKKSGETGEPSLFEEKAHGGGKWKMRFFLVIAISAIGFLLWPKGYITGEGLIQAERFARIGLTSSGILKERLYQKGDVVRKGELLAHFENPDLMRKFEEAKLALEILNHNKTRLEKGLEYLGGEKEAKTILYENSVIGRVQFEKANLDYLQTALELSVRAKEIESAEGEVQFLKEKVESLELRAPFDGMLLSDPGTLVGNFLKEGDFVLEFIDPKSFFLEILISEK